MSTVVSEGLAKRVKLWNDGDAIYDQLVSGDQYTIKPGQYVELPRREAIKVRGHFPGKDVQAKLRIEDLPEREAEKITFDDPARIYACPKCDEEFDDKADYRDHMESHKRVRGKPAERINPVKSE